MEKSSSYSLYFAFYETHNIKRSRKKIYANKSPSVEKKLFMLNIIWLVTFSWFFSVLLVSIGILRCVTILGFFDFSRNMRIAIYHLWPMEYDHFQVKIEIPRIPLSDPFTDFMSEIKKGLEKVTESPTIDDYVKALEPYVLKNQPIEPKQELSEAEDDN
eukprot:TRINITY_DN4057_c0_g2_i2.p1 TRINITY_DN4057_c0_g2~~TRINITY_DN4057_c0_g2_i2.p1  ORF type:complete len:159 (-),score=17.33 TRINITY_DN4057_c0_g2_i2:117-593(-)